MNRENKRKQYEKGYYKTHACDESFTCKNCGNLVERLVGIIDPLLSGVLMFTVGLSLLSVMLPLIGMMNSVG